MWGCLIRISIVRATPTNVGIIMSSNINLELHFEQPPPAWGQVYGSSFIEQIQSDPHPRGDNHTDFHIIRIFCEQPPPTWGQFDSKDKLYVKDRATPTRVGTRIWFFIYRVTPTRVGTISSMLCSTEFRESNPHSRKEKKRVRWHSYNINGFVVFERSMLKGEGFFKERVFVHFVDKKLSVARTRFIQTFGFVLEDESQANSGKSQCQ